MREGRSLDSRKMTRDEFATEARSWGLEWSATTVADIEAGRRQLRFEELVLVLSWMRRAGGSASLGELLDGPGFVRLSPTAQVARRDLRKLLDGDEDVNVLNVQVPWVKRSLQEFMEDHPPPASLYDEAEKRLHRRLRIPVQKVAEAARKAWGRSLTEERDHRVGKMVPPDTDPSTVQAVRGRVTRKLVGELMPLLREED